MADAAAQEWPDRRLKVMVPVWSLLIASTGFLIWRVVYGLTSRRRFLVCDYLLIIAGVSIPCLNIRVVKCDLLVEDLTWCG